ncbi:MAG: ATP-binding protein [Deltaproteobacteria bacterium]|nr:ATP-binding protein [Deltaproteobacteria bacterium]
MEYIQRAIQDTIQHHLNRGKSILLFGPRQTGKSTMLNHFPTDKSITLVKAGTRQRYEKDPSILEREITALKEPLKKIPLVMIDEIQKVPTILDSIQYCIDHNEAQFILTGSSARKLKRSGVLNLLPGRVINLRLDPFTQSELSVPSIEEILLYGSLPGILQVNDPNDREADLQSYVETYLEEEVRSEAMVRNIGGFLRFIEYAGLESGKISNFHKLSQEIGVNHTTIASYFEILEDCLIAERIDPITQSTTRKKLTKASRYLIFDMGVRRLCAGEGTKLGKTHLGELFEQYIGLELIRYSRQSRSKTNVRFWRDPEGPEVDWVLDKEKELIPIEVKWTDTPKERDAKHIKTFLDEYKNATHGYVVCQTPNPVALANNIKAISWKDLAAIF